MPRITPLNWKVLECIFLKDGFTFDRQKGSHRAYVKAGIHRPIIIPTHNEVGVEIIQSNIRTSGMSRERFFELLEECK